jgi:quercetin dioxygenase-like cupin family protein
LQVAAAYTSGETITGAEVLDGDMQVFDMDALGAERARAGRAYLEFLRAPALSMGLYVLPAGGHDGQQPHREDEVYYVLRGRATLRVGAQEQAVAPGALVFVPASVPHHFHTITEELHALVFFAPAESG